MKNLTKIKKDFGVGIMYIPCECGCTCYESSSQASSRYSSTYSDNRAYAN